MTPVWLVALALGAADPATDSWAYVVSAAHVKGSYKHPSDDCRVTAKVPQQRLSSPPANGDEASLGDAVAFTTLVADPYEHCEDYVHTWQPVTFPPGDRSRAAFVSWPRGRVSFTFLFGAFAVLFFLGALAREKLRRPEEPG